MVKEVISRKQRNLILFSESAKVESFDSLYNFLKTNESVIESDLKAQTGLENLLVYLDDLLQACQSEWQPSKTRSFIDLGKQFALKKVKCELCNYKPLRRKHKIENKNSNVKMIIGSECAKEFGDETNKAWEKQGIESFKASRRIILEQEFPGIKKFSETYYKYTKSLDIILSEELEDEWLTFGNNLSKEYEKYLVTPTKNEDALQNFWKEKSSLVAKIEKFIDLNKDEEFVATKEIRTWVENSGSPEVISMIRDNDGILNMLTLHRIHEENLVMKILNKVAPYFREENIELMDYVPSSKLLNIKVMFPKFRLTGNIKYGSFIEEYSELVFDKQSNLVNQETILKMIQMDQQSEEKVVDLFIPSWDKTVGTFVRKSDNKIFIKTKRGEYYQINYSKFIDSTKHLAGQHPIEQKQLELIINNAKEKILSQTEYDRYQDAAKEAGKLL